MLGEQGAQPGGGVVEAAQCQVRLGQIPLPSSAVRASRVATTGAISAITTQRTRLAQRLGRRPKIVGAQRVTAERGQPLEPQRVEVIVGELEAIATLVLGDSADLAEHPAQPRGE